ncbi:MAG: hypothetical protein U1D30_19390 [Planctomycetota bacterium]
MILALLLVSSCCLYAAGIVTNDSGSGNRSQGTSRPAASLGCRFDQTAKVITLSPARGLPPPMFSSVPGVIAMLLTLCILSYNYKAKRRPYGPLVMGFC